MPKTTRYTCLIALALCVACDRTRTSTAEERALASAPSAEARPGAPAPPVMEPPESDEPIVNLDPPISLEPLDLETLAYHAHGPVAHVDGRPIEAKRFNRLAQESMKKYANWQPSASNLSRDVARHIDDLIEADVIVHTAREEGITITRGPVDAEQRRQRDFFMSFESPPRPLDDPIFTHYRAGIARDLALDEIVRRREGIAPTPEEIQAEYDKRRSTYTLDETVEISHIVLAIKPPPAVRQEEIDAKTKLAKELVAKAREPGADFGALAMEHSDAPDAHKGGATGYSQRSDIREDVYRDTAFSLKVGEVSEPILNETTVVIIKVTDRRPPRTQPLSEVEAEIVRDLEAPLLRTGRKKWRQDIKKMHTIERHLDAVEINPPKEPSK